MGLLVVLGYVVWLVVNVDEVASNIGRVVGGTNERKEMGAKWSKNHFDLGC